MCPGAAGLLQVVPDTRAAEASPGMVTVMTTVYEAERKGVFRWRNGFVSRLEVAVTWIYTCVKIHRTVHQKSLLDLTCKKFFQLLKVIQTWNSKPQI